MRRIYRTLSYLKPSQIYHYVRQRGFGPSMVASAEHPGRRLTVMPAQWPGKESIVVDPYAFRFLNAERVFPESVIDWSPSDVSRLWRYNLHYFDYLQEVDRPDHVKLQLVDGWIAANTMGSQPGWEPYTTSLRIANWVKYFVTNPSALTDVRAVSLFTQARWLRKNLELHILANHYFENIKALVFSGVFFSGDESDRWLAFATRELAGQLIEQTLVDGCHYERTPAYHCLMLQNYFELYALMQANPGLFDAALIEQVRSVSVRGLEFLTSILLPGDRIPLFNDSAYNCAPVPAELFAYAATLGLGEAVSSVPRLIEHSDAGIYGYICANDGVLIGCSDIGPAYQPGHTHCDLLSYELILDGRPLVVDTGVYEYEPGEMRNYVRSTRAHNTVSVGGDEQSEIWGEFRVARRAKKLSACMAELDGSMVFEGSYSGFYTLGGKVKHQRTVSIERLGGAINSFDVEDCIEGAGFNTIESFIHLHPDVQLADHGGGSLTLLATGKKYVLTIAISMSYRLEKSFYCSEFGLKIPNDCVVISTRGDRQANMSYQIRKLS